MSSRPDRPPAASRGRPRKRVIDDAILTAARGLLRDAGAEGVTLNAVAVRAAVARATVYRRWPDRTSLLRALVADMGDEPVVRSPGPDTDLAAIVASVNADLVRPDLVGLLPQVISDSLGAEAGSPAFEPAMRHYGEIRAVCRQAATDGSLRTDVEADVVADIVVGALLSHRMRTGRPASRIEVARLTRLITEGVRPRRLLRLRSGPLSGARGSVSSARDRAAGGR